MKKILLLGGSYFQIPSITTAKKLGYYTITCDYLPNNPGHKYADEYHNVSTTNKEAVLKLAKKLNIDGIVCYASDPAATTAAYVSEKMGFPTSPYKSVEILANKDKFRKFLSENGFNTPKAKGYAYSEIAQMFAEINQFKFPVMVKPVDSSGSKGVKKIDCVEDLKSAINEAINYSRCKRFIIEEYLIKSGYSVDGDGFSVNGKLLFRCFGNGHFDSNGINPYVPIGISWPYTKSSKIQQKMHNDIQRVLSLLNMETQSYNFEIMEDVHNEIYLMEIGPRNGGNLIPQVTKYATGIDMVEYTIKSAMGESCEDLKMNEPNGFWSSYIIHSQKSGILNDIVIKDKFKDNIVHFDMLYRRGDHVDAFTGSNGTLGMMILKFKSQDEMLEKMNNMNKWVEVLIESENVK